MPGAKLSIEEMRALATAVAAEVSPDISVAGVTVTDGGSERAELIVLLEGCHEEPCRLLLNLPRADSSDFARELDAKLREAITEHV